MRNLSDSIDVDAGGVQVDRAGVSLVDKELMKVQQTAIGEKLRSWLKTQLASRIESASARVDELAAAAAANNLVLTLIAFVSGVC